MVRGEQNREPALISERWRLSARQGRPEGAKPGRLEKKIKYGLEMNEKTKFVKDMLRHPP
jgi:DNA invertase Pin-like site-specific DNA recombinase